MLLRLLESQSVAGHPLAVIAVKVAAAAGEDSLEVHGVRLGDSVRQEGAKGRYGDSGCLGGPLFPSLAGCGEHRGPQQDRGCKRAFRAPPARRSTQHRPGSCFHWGARKAPPNQATAQTSPGDGSHPRAPGSFGEAALGVRELVERSKRRMLPRLARAPPGAAASEVSALTLPPLGSAACGFLPQSQPLRVSSLSRPAREPLKGTRDPCHVLSGAAQTSSAC